MRTKEDFKSQINFIFTTFLKLLKESEIGFGVTTDGTFIFYDQVTGKELYILKEHLEKVYEEI